MSDKFDRFTKRARRVLTLAQEEAQRLNHNYIGTEHLLLGLVREENGVAVRVLRELGVDPKQIRERVERYRRSWSESHVWQIKLDPPYQTGY